MQRPPIVQYNSFLQSDKINTQTPNTNMLHQRYRLLLALMLSFGSYTLIDVSNCRLVSSGHRLFTCIYSLTCNSLNRNNHLHLRLFSPIWNEMARQQSIIQITVFHYFAHVRVLCKRAHASSTLYVRYVEYINRHENKNAYMPIFLLYQLKVSRKK